MAQWGKTWAAEPHSHGALTWPTPWKGQPCGDGEDPTPPSCPPTSTHVPWHIQTHTLTHTHTQNKIVFKTIMSLLNKGGGVIEKYKKTKLKRITCVQSPPIPSNRYPQNRWYLTGVCWIQIQTHKSQTTARERNPKIRTSEDVQKEWKTESHQTRHGYEVNPLKSTLGKALIPEPWTDAVTTSTSFRTNN